MSIFENLTIKYVKNFFVGRYVGRYKGKNFYIESNYNNDTNIFFEFDSETNDNSWYTTIRYSIIIDKSNTKGKLRKIFK